MYFSEGEHRKSRSGKRGDGGGLGGVEEAEILVGMYCVRGVKKNSKRSDLFLQSYNLKSICISHVPHRCYKIPELNEGFFLVHSLRVQLCCKQDPGEAVSHLISTVRKQRMRDALVPFSLV